MDWRSELRRTWALQAPADSSPGEVTAFPIARTRAGAELRVYVDDLGGRHLLIPAGPGGATLGDPGVALQVTNRSLNFASVTEEFVDLGCRRADLYNVFDDLLVSILEAAVVADQAVSAAVQVISSWRDLLRASLANLSFERELGLFAELWILREVTRGHQLDVSIWRGPLREPKDIVQKWGWVEVKGIGPRVDEVTINGLAQLDDIPGMAGRLAVLIVAEDPGGRTVGELVDELAADVIDRTRLDERLLLAGWPGSRDGDRRWSVTDMAVADAGKLPRITASTLVGGVPAGLVNVKYDLKVAVVRSLSLRDPWAGLRVTGTQA